MTRAPRSARVQAGLTLIEVLISMAVLGFMLVIGWGTIAQATRAKRHYEAVQERYRNVRVALGRLEKDLSMAYLSGNEDTTAMEHRTFFHSDSSMSYDAVRFTTFAHERLWAEANESDQSAVSYYTGPDPEDPRTTDLFRKETHRLANPNEKWDTPPSDTDVLMVGITKFKLQFWNVQNKQWDESWSTISADGKPGKLPDRVKITVGFTDERGKEVVFVSQTKIHLQEVLQFYAN
jgi:general secretion pathway protein J